MNRWVIRISAVCLGTAIAFSSSPSAFAKRHKKKKETDLSVNPLGNVKSEQPDKILFDKAANAMKHGKYDVARLDLQTLLNTYPDSEYQMRAKLMVGDTWFKEGGSAALTQAESEYKDFITFFPNSPEAAEAQMKVGDIYFEQMEKPDRDPQNAVHAEQEYRTMLEQFPDSPLIPRATQRLREVQEVLGQRQFEIGEFYASREQWAAAIARLQTVADTYPLFSKDDEALITIGDAYAEEAQLVARANIPPKARAELVRHYDDQAATAWSRVVTRYPLAPHVEDAKDRLIALGRPVPTPTQQELAESQAEEDSRVNFRLGSRAVQIFGRGPNTVRAARVGDPSLNSPPPVIAPDIVKDSATAWAEAMAGKPITGVAAPAAQTANAAIDNGTAPPTSNHPAQSTGFQDVPEGTAPTGNSVSVQIPSDNGGSAPGAGASPMETVPGDNPAPAAAPSNAEPLVKPVGPTDNKPLPAVDKPAEAPQQVNEVPAGGGNAQVQTGANASGKPNKKKKAPYDKKDESSSKHKKKTGLDKLNPF
ncbi:MAG TPA: outer membrane protein assembly factor BamD [Acidobacteriaceae bacterium]|nr:outer membrane protein assembly factor BamD [Acidobacteriaceae bacterium]